MDKQARLKHWARLASIPEREVSSERDLSGFFQRFRPDGRGVEQVFEGIVAGGRLLERLKECYAATGPGYREGDAYFIVRNVPATDLNAILGSAIRHLRAMGEIAATVGDDELRNLLRLASPRIVSRGDRVDIAPPNDESPEVWLYDVVTDYMCTLMPLPSDGLLLGEAFFSIGNDQYLKNYLLWPLYEEASKIVDPFRAYFDLWRQGARLTFRTRDSCWVHVQLS